MLNGGQKREKMALRTENVENGGYEKGLCQLNNVYHIVVSFLEEDLNN